MSKWERFWNAFRGYGVGAMIGVGVGHFAASIDAPILVQIAVLLFLMAVLLILVRIIDQ